MMQCEQEVVKIPNKLWILWDVYKGSYHVSFYSWSTTLTSLSLRAKHLHRFQKMISMRQNVISFILKHVPSLPCNLVYPESQIKEILCHQTAN